MKHILFFAPFTGSGESAEGGAVRAATELAYAEVISYNRKNLERELQNEGRQQDKMQSRGNRREGEI